MTKTVAIGIPSGNTVQAATSMALIDLVGYSMSRDISIAMLNRRGSMIPEQRNDIVTKALEHGVDYIFWHDSDMVAPKETLVQLMSHGRDIVGCLYPKRVPPYPTLGRLKAQPKPGLNEADYIPGGMVLVKTEVYRQLGYPYYWLANRAWRGSSPIQRLINMIDDMAPEPMPDGVKTSIHNNRALRAWLDNAAENDMVDGNYMAEDFYLCRRATRAGFKLWVDMDLSVRIGHLTEGVSVIDKSIFVSQQGIPKASRDGEPQLATGVQALAH